MKIFLKKRTIFYRCKSSPMMASLVVVKVQHKGYLLRLPRTHSVYRMWCQSFYFVFISIVFFSSHFFFLQIIKALYIICHVLFVFAPIGGVLVVLLFVQPWPSLQKSCERCLLLAQSYHLPPPQLSLALVMSRLLLLPL